MAESECQSVDEQLAALTLLPSSETANPITQRNAASSPLLKLPAELRHAIYEYALGGHLIHVHVDHKQIATWRSQAYDFVQDFLSSEGSSKQHREGFAHASYYICRATRSEDDAYRRFRNEALDERLPGEEHWIDNLFRVGDAFYTETCLDRHRDCRLLKEEWSPFDPRRDGVPSDNLRDLLSLNLLLACSQIYQEAKAIAFQSNTFGFDSPLSLCGYLSPLTLAQRGYLRSLWIMSSTRYMQDLRLAALWNRAIFRPDQLAGLRQVHISLFFQYVSPARYVAQYIRGTTHEENQDVEDWMDSLQCFQKFPLNKATVMISDTNISDSKGEVDPQWVKQMFESTEEFHRTREVWGFSAQEHREWAEELEGYMRKAATQQH